MSRARDLSRFANNQAISVDSSLNVGINSSSPDAKLDVVGIVSATEFYGDGSNLTGVSSPGLGTALSDDTTSPLNSIYFTNANLSVASTITVNPPSSASAAFTQYANIVLQNDADLIVGDGDTFIPDILGIGTGVDEPGTLTGGAGKLRVDNITDKAGTGAPNFPNGVVFTGLTTAPGGVQVSTGATISGSTNTITALTNGSERLRIASDGKIGIGTDPGAPTARLSIKASSAGEYVQDFKGSSTKQWGFWFLQNNWEQSTFRIDEFDSSGNHTPRLTIYNGGKVCIGTVTAGHANGDNLTLSDSGDCGLTIRSENSGEGVIYFSDATSGAGQYAGQVSYIHSADALRFATAGTERVRITSTGIVQCGTSSVLKAEINNAVSGHQFISQCSDNNNGFEVYQQHGSNTTRNTFAVYDNRGGSGAKQLAFAVRGDGLTIHQNAITFKGETAVANQLDDYEEGSWTVTCGNGVTLHSNCNTATYTKIGRKVTVTGQIRVLNNNSNSNLFINNLPFGSMGWNTNTNDSIAVGSVRLYNAGITGTSKGLICVTDNGTFTLYFNEIRDNNSDLGVQSTTNGFYIFNITYFTSS